VFLSNEVSIVHSGIKAFTVYDLLSAVFSEISFHGYSDDKKKLSEELNQRIKDVESGKMKTYSLEEVKKKFVKK